MKAPINDPEQEKLDLLLFEYLEEELPEFEAEALEKRLAEDPALQQELESWEATYVSQDFYDTRLLEEKLLSPNINPKLFTFSSSLNAVLLGIITTLVSFMLITDESNTKVPAVPVLNKPVDLAEKEAEIVEEIEMHVRKELIAEGNAISEQEEEQQRVPVKKEPEAKNTSLTIAETKAGRKQRLPQLESMPMILPVSHFNETVLHTDVKRVKVAKKESTPKISRRQQRMIEKSKEKALQERKAREFMKGNVPYVVPLNSQNF
jgi:hypothetical protein